MDYGFFNVSLSCLRFILKNYQTKRKENKTEIEQVKMVKQLLERGYYRATPGYTWRQNIHPN